MMPMSPASEAIDVVAGITTVRGRLQRVHARHSNVIAPLREADVMTARSRLRWSQDVGSAAEDLTFRYSDGAL